jgi:hypothetical protein
MIILNIIKNMAYRKRKTPSKRKYIKRKRTFRRKRGNAATKLSSAIVRSPQAFPDRYMCKLKTQGSFNITSTSNYANASLYANSLYDPLGTMGVIYPPYVQTLGLIYHYATVDLVHVDITLLQNCTGPMYVCCFPINDNATIATFQLAREQPFAKSTLMPANTSGTDQVKKMRFTFRCSAIAGMTPKSYLDEFNFSNLNLGTNPSNVVFFYIGIYSVSTVYTTPSVIADVIITQNCLFWEKKAVTYST